MRDRFAQVIRAVNATPWAITPEALEVITGLIEMRAAGEKLSREEIDARIAGGPGRGGGSQLARGGVAVIPISGPITPRATLFSDVSGGTSMEGVVNAFHDAMDDSDVASILLDVNSPGGLVEMVPEAAAAIRSRRGEKPITAVANTLAGSAAYWLAAQADELYVTPSGLVGSIGVFGTHTDISGAQDQAGIKTTIVSAGKYKTEGNTFEPLSDEARAAKQELVDAMYGMFVADVAAGRGVAESAVRNGYGEGRVLDARAAEREGMVDGVQTFEQTLRSIVRRQSPSTRSAAASSAAQVDPPDLEAAAIAAHSTPTTDKAWDGPAAKANLRNDEKAPYYRRAYAWVDGGADPDVKASYKFIHHEVASGGEIGAANVNGCRAGIGVLNGGRGGTTIPSSDRQGVYNHLARHMRDGGTEPPPLKSQAQIDSDAGGAESFVDQVTAVVATAEGMLADGRCLTAAKLGAIDVLSARLGELRSRGADAGEAGVELTADHELEWLEVARLR